jgi:hypothetical protein
LFIEFFNKRNNSVLQVKRKINSLQEKFQKNERKKKNAGKLSFLALGCLPLRGMRREDDGRKVLRFSKKLIAFWEKI